jgi:CRISPR type III-A-associated RAMP protein Csm4
MKCYKISLTPYSSFNKLPDSQTLFGSICWAIKDLYGEENLETILEDFYNHDKKFVVSSVFPMDLVTCPLETWTKLSEINNVKKYMSDKSIVSKRAKDLKKVKFMSLNIFKEYLIDKVDKKEVFTDIVLGKQNPKYKLINGVLSFDNEDILPLELSVSKERRNSINRLAGSTMENGLYYYNKMFLGGKNSLYFLFKTSDIDFYLPIFKYLSDGAIGSDKSVGMNSYRIDFEGEFQYNKEIEESILLSKYIPNYEEIQWDRSSYKIQYGKYKIESRDSFMGEDILKKDITFLTEGSKLLLNSNKEIYGQLPIVKLILGKKIRHNGIGFFL